MKVPLLCDIHDRDLTIVCNGKGATVDLPFLPFLTVPTSRATDTIRRTIGTGIPTQLERIRYSGTEELEKAYIPGRMSKLRYIEQIYTELPDYFYDYPNTDPLGILALDIEVLTDGSGIFPRASTNPIVAIGIGIVGGPDTYTYSISADDLDRPLPDQGIILDAIEAMCDLDPDILVTYNGINFDMPYLLERMAIVGIDSRTLGRYSEESTPTNIPWRIHWDLWRDVDNDQTLTGLPNRRLKTVGHHFGWSAIDLGRDALSNTSPLVGTEELLEYLASDVQLTGNLASVYIENHIALAEMIGIPLREEIGAYSSLVPKVLHIRNLKDRYIGLDSNTTKYMGELGTVRYQAARVALYDDGEEVEVLGKYYPKVWGVDFGSQYPTCMITFNLSPETTQIVEVRPYTGEYRFLNEDGILWLNLPDRNADKQIVIKVDTREDGFLRTCLNDYKEERARIRSLPEYTPTDKALYSRQWSLKVVMNSIYGYNGLSTARWGDLAVAIATVGICRWLIMEVEDYLGTSKVSTDTDGILIDTEPDIDAINEFISNTIHSTMSIPCQMSVEEEEYGAAWIYRSKNYIMEDAGTIVRKGAVFKSSRHSRIYSMALDTLCAAILSQVGDMWPVVRELEDWSRYGITDFIMHTTFNQDPLEYSNPNTLQPRLARQALSVLGMELGKGDGVDYIVTKGRQYTIASTVNNIDMVDIGYYSNEIGKLLSVFGIDGIQQLDLF